MQRSIVFPDQVAEVSVHYSSRIDAKHLPKISHSVDAVEVFLSRWDKGMIGYVEEFKILLLNRANCVMGVVKIGQGGISGTLADPKVIFAAALKARASSLIAAHNHPSGNLKPSETDMKLTRKIKEAGQFLDLSLLDHVILSPNGEYFSFADEGLL